MFTPAECIGNGMMDEDTGVLLFVQPVQIHRGVQVAGNYTVTVSGGGDRYHVGIC